jgi:hypothetical protein
MIYIETTVGFESAYPIVDVEIANNISNGNKEWKYQESDITCCSVLFGNKIRTLFRNKEDSIIEYKKQLQTILPQTMYAFNERMEHGSFLGFLGIDYDIKEIKAFKGKGWNKEKFYQELLKDGKIIPNPLIDEDKLKDDSSLCISLYAEGKKWEIIEHNIIDVIKQYYILIFKDYFLTKYKSRISQDGWIN